LVSGTPSYWTDGKRIVIARLIPDIERHVVVHPGTCYGCGINEDAPIVTSTRPLGTIDPASVDVVDVHYHFDRIEETCADPRPGQ